MRRAPGLLPKPVTGTRVAAARAGDAIPVSARAMAAAISDRRNAMVPDVTTYRAGTPWCAGPHRGASLCAGLTQGAAQPVQPQGQLQVQRPLRVVPPGFEQ